MDEIEKRILKIEKAVQKIMLEQEHINEQVNKSFVLHETTAKDLKDMGHVLIKMEYYEEFKKKFISDLQRWGRILLILIPALMSIEGLVAYDWGLKTPVPEHYNVK